MRTALVLLVLSIGSIVPAQDGTGRESATRSLFMTTRIDATVVVHKHKMGADLVEIAVLKPTYSADLLEKQVRGIAHELNEEPRGLSLYRYPLDGSDPKSDVLKASFAVDGLIDETTGVLRLEPIARGMCLATATDQLNCLMVQFERETPTSRTLQSCSPPAPGCSGAAVEGQPRGPDLGVEYRVKLLSHDPNAIHLPDAGVPPARVAAAVRVARPKTDWTLYVLLLVSAVAVGALVYSLLLRGGARGGTGGGTGGGAGGGSGHRPPNTPKGRSSTRF